MLCVMENKCAYKAWVAPKSNTESGTQEVIHSNSDVKYRFESCPDYTLKTKVMDIEIAVIVGWLVLMSSWIIPSFIKESFKKTFVRISLSALATGIFIGHVLSIIF